MLREVILNRENWRFYSAREPDFQIGRSSPTGHRALSLCGGSWPEHRVIWKIETGREPEGFIDHINGIRDDNRIENLRDVTPRENMLNTRRGYWAAIAAERKAAAKLARKAEREEKKRQREERERALLAKLKAKYESNDHASSCQAKTLSYDFLKPR